MSVRIVVADDEAYVRRVLSMKLSEAAYDVVTAADGEEALELCRKQPPALLITDNQMPTLEGVDLCRELHADPSVPPFPVILLTARDFEFAEQDLAQVGVAAVLGKPFSPRELLRRVEQILGGVARSAAPPSR